MKLKFSNYITVFFMIFFTLYIDSNQNLTTKATNEPFFTAFDWEYYVQHNNLHHLATEADALEHYQKIGFFEKLEYCKKFNIVILLHLYDLGLLDEFINRINNLVRLNDLNHYIIKVNIPIDSRLNSFHHKEVNNILSSTDGAFNKVLDSTPYHQELVTDKNSKILYKISKYLKENIEIDDENIQVLFSENRGSNVGGFFLLLDQVIKQNIQHDFVIKLHTHPDSNARKKLTSFLNVKLNKALRHHQALYSNPKTFDFKHEDSNSYLKDLLSFFGLPQKSFNFCNGGMFIVSHVFTEFFENYDLTELFNKLPKGEMKEIGQAYNSFFGYIIDHLNFNTLIIPPTRFKYFYDNTVAIKSSISLNYDLDYVRQLIQKNNIKTMAIYFPQFHEVEENNRLWGEGFTEWTMMNRFRGDIKKPHVDIGQYNMLDYSTRKKQALIAKEHGINAFCYYHYWFADKKVMYKGVEKILEDGEPDLPFVFCWANEPWTRNWDGSQKEILIDQKYGSKESWEKHFYYLLQFFKHTNYIKEENCPLFFIYNISHMIKCNALKMLKTWKELAKQAGFNGLKIVCVLGVNRKYMDLDDYVDGFAEHHPTYISKYVKFKHLTIEGKDCLDSEDLSRKISSMKRLNGLYYSGLFYSFDNSSRRIGKPSYKFAKLSYQGFEKTLVDTIARISIKPNKGNNFLLINSWNEWTEQAMIEPNDTDGYRLLESIKKLFI